MSIDFQKLKNKFDLIFDIFGVKNILEFNSKITKLKGQANLEDNLSKLKIDINKSSKSIIDGINLLRLGNNPIKIDGKNIYDIISKT